MVPSRMPHWSFENSVCVCVCVCGWVGGCGWVGEGFAFGLRAILERGQYSNDACAHAHSPKRATIFFDGCFPSFSCIALCTYYMVLDGGKWSRVRVFRLESHKNDDIYAGIASHASHFSDFFQAMQPDSV